MLSVSDILAILDKIPAWKAVVGLPKRVAEMEARLAALEGGSKSSRAPSATDCPKCHATMIVEAEDDDPIFGTFGMKQHILRCEVCGNRATRQFNPARGYE